jgi:hypothetical protein
MDIYLHIEETWIGPILEIASKLILREINVAQIEFTDPTLKSQNRIRNIIDQTINVQFFPDRANQLKSINIDFRYLYEEELSKDEDKKKMHTYSIGIRFIGDEYYLNLFISDHSTPLSYRPLFEKFGNEELSDLIADFVVNYGCAMAELNTKKQSLEASQREVDRAQTTVNYYRNWYDCQKFHRVNKNN